MIYCLNPNCQQYQDEDINNVCSSCGSNLLLGDRYYAIKIIGQGGFGKTYLAVDKLETNSQLCVIKQFTFASSATALRLFTEEAKRLKTLGTHPQIPTFIDYVEQENQYFIVQEYIDGSNLEEELAANGTFNESRIEELLADILPVTKLVHEGGVIHRDIKPENIIRRKSDRKLFLVDFGAAKRATETALAKTGTTIGSAGYAAPEQTFGKAVTQSDLYSLGVTCIHLLTGIHPFDLIDSASGEWVWRDYLKEPISPKLGQILDKLLERGTRGRYQSAAEVLQDLQGTARTYAIAAKDLSREVAELDKRSPEALPARRFHSWKAAAVSLLAVGGLVAIPVTINVLNQAQVANIPNAQGSKAPAPKPMPAPQKPKQSAQDLQEDKATQEYLLLFVSIVKVVSFIGFIFGCLSILRAIQWGESLQEGVTLSIAAFVLVIIANTTPSLLGINVATGKSPSTPTKDAFGQILLNPQRK